MRLRVGNWRGLYTVDDASETIEVIVIAPRDGRLARRVQRKTEEHDAPYTGKGLLGRGERHHAAAIDLPPASSGRPSARSLAAATADRTVARRVPLGLGGRLPCSV